MPESKAKIMRHCIVCGKPFLAKNVDSVHCSKKCSNETYRNKKRAEKREMERQSILAESEGNALLKWYRCAAVIKFLAQLFIGGFVKGK